MEAGRKGRISVRVEKTRAGLEGDGWDEDGEDDDEGDEDENGDDGEDDNEDDKNKFHYSEATSTMIYFYAS